MRCYDEAVTAFQQLVENGRTEAARSFVKPHVCRGAALNEGNKLAEALKGYEKAFDVVGSMVERGENDVRDLCAAIFQNMGVTLDRLGRLEVALGCYDRALGALQPLVRAGGKPRLVAVFAELLSNKGITLDRMRQPDQSLQCHDEALGLLQPLVDAGAMEFVQKLATTLINKGAALSALGERERARECFAAAERSLGLLGSAVPPDVENQRAAALMNRGVEFWKDQLGPEALACQEKAVPGPTGARGTRLWGLRSLFGRRPLQSVPRAAACEAARARTRLCPRGRGDP